MSLQLLSWNCNGLNHPRKKRQVFHILKREQLDILDLEGFDNRFGWHAYIWYDKVKAHKGFKNHMVRKALYNVWIRYKDLFESRTPRWLSPMEAKEVKKLNMGSNWPKYFEIIEQDGEKVKLQSFEKLKFKVRDWLH